MDSSPQYRADMRAVWDYVDEAYCSRDILGAKVADALLVHAARASHHEFPFGMTVLAQLMSCTNGATSEFFPGVDSPIVLPIFNINFPQTRKSSGFGTGVVVGAALDERALLVARAEAGLRCGVGAVQSEPGHAGASASPPASTPGAAAVGVARKEGAAKIRSSVLSSFTEAAFFQRCAGDWGQVQAGDDVDGWRCTFGTLVNLDEAYKYFKMGGLMPHGPASKGGDSSIGALTDAASELNKLFQTGRTSLVTKTSGTFGEGEAPCISLGLTGNAHPSTVIPMLRGEFGSDVTACSHRHLFCSGAPVEPHQALPNRLLLPEGTPRWLWPQLLECMVAPLGLPDGITRKAVAAAMYKPLRGAAPVDDDSNDEKEADRLFQPNASGYAVTLADGSNSRLRYRKREGAAGEAWHAELRAANRDVPIPDGCSLKSMAVRVLDYFKAPHQKMQWTVDAKLAFKGFQMVFDCQGAKFRDEGRVSVAARYGAGPWHLGILSVALVVCEIALGDDSDDVVEEAEEPRQTAPLIPSSPLHTIPSSPQQNPAPFFHRPRNPLSGRWGLTIASAHSSS